MEWLTPERAGSAMRMAWLALALYWVWTWRSGKPTARRESLLSKMSYTALMAAGLVVMLGPGFAALRDRILPSTPGLLAAAVAVTWAGVLFAVWARAVLGGNWSAMATVKEGHELIRRGPYRLVRHPIYSGILAGCAGAAVNVDRWQAPIGLALVFLGFLRKSRIEERFMTEQFGAAYEEYRRTTRAFIPHVI